MHSSSRSVRTPSDFPWFSTGWWLTYPSEKWWSASNGIILPSNGTINISCSKPPTSPWFLIIHGIYPIIPWLMGFIKFPLSHEKWWVFLGSMNIHGVFIHPCWFLHYYYLLLIQKPIAWYKIFPYIHRKFTVNPLVVTHGKGNKTTIYRWFMMICFRIFPIKPPFSSVISGRTSWQKNFASLVFQCRKLPCLHTQSPRSLAGAWVVLGHEWCWYMYWIISIDIYGWHIFKTTCWSHQPDWSFYYISTPSGNEQTWKKKISSIHWHIVWYFTSFAHQLTLINLEASRGAKPWWFTWWVMPSPHAN